MTLVQFVTEISLIVSFSQEYETGSIFANGSIIAKNRSWSAESWGHGPTGMYVSNRSYTEEAEIGGESMCSLDGDNGYSNLSHDESTIPFHLPRQCGASKL